MKTLEKLAREAAGMLLGVHPDKVEHSTTWLEQVRVVRQLSRAEALEEAAQRCEQLQDDGYTEVELGGEMPDAVDCAAAIREMK